MKFIKNITTVLLAVLLCITIISCDRNSIIDSADGKMYSISLNMGGEILDVETSPLTRTSNSDLYGIQVYSAPVSQEDNMGYTPCAFGLFDNIENLSINLLAGKKYKFVVTLLIDAKNILAYYGHYYRTPFDITDPYKVSTPLNVFTNSIDCYFTSLSSGRTELSFGSYYYSHPTADRYYGELAGYEPSEGGSVNINLKRVVFGVKYIVQGMDEGELKVQLKDAPEITIDNSAKSTEKIIHTFENVLGAYNSDNYTEKIPVTFLWNKGETEIPQGTYEFDFQRNKLTTITFKVMGESLSSGLGINIESIEITNGENITVEDGVVIETPINPSQN